MGLSGGEGMSTIRLAVLTQLLDCDEQTDRHGATAHSIPR